MVMSRGVRLSIMDNSNQRATLCFSSSCLFANVLCLICLLFIHPAWAAVAVQAEGTAQIVGDNTVLARSQAINDAMRQASMQASSRVNAATRMANNVIEVDTVRVQTSAEVSDVVILDEWIDDNRDVYHVLLRAHIKSENSRARTRSRHDYRYKLAVTQFDVADRMDIQDLPRFEVEFAREYLRRLQVEQNLFVVDATDYNLKQSLEPYLALGHTPQQLIVDLARRLGVQFVVSGNIQDMATTQHFPLVELRHVEVEILVHDGISGALVSRHKALGSTWQGGWLDFPTTTPVFSDKFFASPIGQEINKTLKELVSQTAHGISQLPFTARVLKVQGGRVFFDVGTTSLVQVGDVLMGYKLDSAPLMDVAQGQFFGYVESPLAAITVRQVQPLFAVGEVNLDKGAEGLQAGDVLRLSW